MNLSRLSRCLLLAAIISTTLLVMAPSAHADGQVQGIVTRAGGVPLPASSVPSIGVKACPDGSFSEDCGNVPIATATTSGGWSLSLPENAAYDLWVVNLNNNRFLGGPFDVIVPPGGGTVGAPPMEIAVAIVEGTVTRDGTPFPPDTAGVVACPPSEGGPFCPSMRAQHDQDGNGTYALAVPPGEWSLRGFHIPGSGELSDENPTFPLGDGDLVTQNFNIPPPPSITVTPSSGLVEGQSVTVEGSGYTPSGDNVWVGQCLAAPDPAVCDKQPDHQVLVPVDAEGKFSTSVTVHETFTGGTDANPNDPIQVDCTVAPGCFMSGGQSNPSRSAVQFISFGAPPPAPSITVSPSTGLDSGPGNVGTPVDVSGTGFPPNSQVAVLQCANAPPIGGNSPCNVQGAVYPTTDGNGAFPAISLTVYDPMPANITTPAQDYPCGFSGCSVVGAQGMSFDNHPISFGAPPPPASITVNPSTGLDDGDLVTVSGTGFLSGQPVAVLQCANAEPIGGNSPCNVLEAVSPQPVADGSGNFGPVSLTVRDPMPANVTTPDQDYPCGSNGCYVVAVQGFPPTRADSQVVTFGSQATVTGTVLPEFGDPFPAGTAGVGACPAPGTGPSCPGLQVATADAAGNYTLVLPAGTYNMAGFANGGQIIGPSQSVPLMPGETATRFFGVPTPQPGQGLVQVSVTGADGRFLGGFPTVTAAMACHGSGVPTALGACSDGAPAGVVPFGPIGPLNLHLPPGTYNVVGFPSAAGIAVATPQPVTVSEGGVSAPTFAYAEVHGRVTRADGSPFSAPGQPTIRACEAPQPPDPSCTGLVSQALPDGNGDYTLYLAAGTYNFAPTFGTAIAPELTETVTGGQELAGRDFTVEDSAFVTLTGTVSAVGSSGFTGVGACLDPEVPSLPATGLPATPCPSVRSALTSFGGGTYSLALGPGTWNVIAFSQFQPGNGTTPVEQIVVPNPEGEVVTRDYTVVPPPSGLVTGHVTGFSPGTARVTATPASAGPCGPFSPCPGASTAVNQADGSYALVLGPGEWRLRASRSTGPFPGPTETTPDVIVDVGVGETLVCDFAFGGAPPDCDGIPNAVEDGAPNGGDGNDDGTLDSQQPHVASLPSAVAGSPYVTVAAPPETTLVGVQAIDPSTLPPPPGGHALPVGVLTFEVHGVAPGAMVPVEVHTPAGTAPVSYLKYQHGAWSDFTANSTFDGDVVTLVLTDGGAGDADGTANGRVVDPGAPALAAAEVDGEVVEGDEGPRDVEVDVELASRTDVKKVRIDYCTEDGSAVAHDDYRADCKHVILNRHETSARIKLKVRGDELAEDDEDFFVGLTAQGGTLVDDRLRIVIRDDD